MRKFITVLFITVMTITTLTGCFNTEPVTSNEPKVLRILGDEIIVENDSSYFEIAQGNVEIEIIDLSAIYRGELDIFLDNKPGTSLTPEDQIKAIMNGPNPPDIIYLDQSQLSQFIEEGLIIPLDSFIEKDQFDLNGIAPGVLEGIKDIGNGYIYALSPIYQSQALFYNKSIFDQKNIPYPEDRMSWEEIFNLARQLTYEEDGKKIYGLAFQSSIGDDEYTQMSLYLDPLNLNYFNEEYTSMNINSPQWEEVWNLFAQLYKDGIIAPPYNHKKARESGRPISYFDRKLFLGGRAAMAIENAEHLRELEEVMQGDFYYGELREQAPKFEWDIVTLPIHPEVGDVGGNMDMYGLMAINANAEQKELAWKYISFMNGDKMSKVNTKTNIIGYSLPIRIEHVKQPEGMTVNLNAFTLLKPAIDYTDVEFRKKYPHESPYPIMSIGNELFKEVLEGKKTVKEALAEFEVRGQEILDNIILESQEN